MYLLLYCSQVVITDITAHEHNYITRVVFNINSFFSIILLRGTGIQVHRQHARQRSRRT